MKWLWVVLCSGCLASNSVQCADGSVCPQSTVCDMTHHLCVSLDQLSACAGAAEAADCMYGDVAGHCQDGVCLHAVCGDSIVEYGEMCDDGNTKDGDGCAADCLSNLTCGNGVTDSTTKEQCDDGALLDHDGCSSGCQLETPHWIEHTLTPPIRASSAFAYDTRRGRIVVFGGIASAGGNYTVLDDTLEWNGGDWVIADPASVPGQRYASAMAYDVDHGVSVMYGGFDGTFDLSDTWLWDGSVWTSVNVAGPPERYGHAMVYDPKRHVVVLFGGFNDRLGELDDTWEWDGTGWHDTSGTVRPPKRENPAMTYDPRAGVIIMTGGDKSAVPYADTWNYDGTWHQNAASGGPNVSQAGITYDLASQRVVLFGGIQGFTLEQNTWVWNGATWSNLGAAPISARRGPVMASTGARVVLMGGAISTQGVNDTWFFANNAWTQPQTPGARRDTAMVNDFANSRAILFGGQDPSAVSHGDTWQLTRDGFSLVTNPPPVKRSNMAMAWDPVHHYVLMFGGFDFASMTYYNDTWTFDGSTWSQKPGGSPPSVRADAALAFDGKRMILFGGHTSTVASTADTWAWDGATWTQLSVSGPSARYGATTSYDPIRDRLVLFGGAESDSFDDTWVFDDSAWTDVSTGFRPSKRYSASLVWNPAREKLILVGGNSAVTDAYEWDGANWALVPATHTPPGRLESTAITTLDGGGVLVYGGSTTTVVGERWELRWDGPHVSERCDASDTDGDKLVGCADPDCWPICTPLCFPGTSCDPAAPRCGDGACDMARESCRTCPGDCGACTFVCGDGICDPNEPGCPGDCHP